MSYDVNMVSEVASMSPAGHFWPLVTTRDYQSTTIETIIDKSGYNILNNSQSWHVASPEDPTTLSRDLTEREIKWSRGFDNFVNSNLSN